MRKSLSTILIAAAIATVVSCQKEEKETPAANPVVNIENCKTVSAEGETITLKVTISDPVENGAGQTKVTPDCDWIDSPVFTETALTFDVLKYETDEENPENRTAVITVEYPDAETVKVKVTQSAPAIEEPDDPETPETPVVNVTWDSTTVVPVEGGTYTAAYSIEHPAEDAALKAVPEQDWITVTGTQDGIIAFTVAGNDSEPGSGPRHGTISLSYPGADDITPITFIQEAEEEVVEEGLTFTIDITSVSSDGVYFNITVSDEEATYYRAVMEKTEFDAFGSDMALIEEDIEYFLSEDWLGNPGSIEDYIYTGSEQDCYEYLYNADTDYYIYAYGLNTDGTVTSKVFKEEFRTTEPELQDCTFEFIVRPTLEGMRINVIPSNTSVQYYWSVMPKNEFDAYGKDAADKIAEELLEESQASGTGMGQILFYHNQSEAFNEFNNGEKYVVFAFGCDVSGVVTTPLMKEEFSAMSLEKVNCSFSITPKDIMSTTFSAEIIPSDPNQKWFAYTLPYEVLEAYPSLEEMTDEVLDILCSSGADWMSALAYTGTQTLSNYDMMGEAAIPETRQFIGVMAISEYGTRISNLTTSSLVTNADDGSDDVNIDVNIEILNKSASNASVKFTPYPDEYYVYGVLETSFFDGYDTDDVKIASVLSYYVINDMLNTRITFDELIYNPDGLTKGTEYTAFAFGYTDIVGKTFFSETFVAE